MRVRGGLSERCRVGPTSAAGGERTAVLWPCLAAMARRGGLKRGLRWPNPAPGFGFGKPGYGVTARFVKNRTLSRPAPAQMPNLGHSSHQLPFGKVLQQVCGTQKGREMRGHASPFENERLCKLLKFLAFPLSVQFRTNRPVTPCTDRPGFQVRPTDGNFRSREFKASTSTGR